MQRMKNTASPRPRPPVSLMMGMMIGGAIMAMATQAMMMGATVATRDSSLKTP
jgi:hypothetical protein